MPSRGNHPVWFVAGPTKWPETPDQMSLSRLREIEACPRRWALEAAYFPEIWARRGYPNKPHAAALVGRIVHLAVEVIVKALMKERCAGISDPKASSVIMELGGYGRIIDDCSLRVFSDYADNPRAQPYMQPLQQRIQSLRPDIRERVQMIVARTTLTSRSDSGSSGAREGRHRLAPGAHAEVELIAKDISWIGIADLIQISDDLCEIHEIKTGEPDDEHRFQLQVYSALWAYDKERNPTGRLATKLTLCYQTGNVDVPILSKPELDALAETLKSRRLNALSALHQHPPAAKPSKDTCKHCSVRQLCEPYWESGHSLEESPDGAFCDLEVVITGEHGTTSWEGTSAKAGPLPIGSKLLIRTTQQSEGFRTGARVRILDLHLAVSHDSQPSIASAGQASEIFILQAGTPIDSI